MNIWILTKERNFNARWFVSLLILWVAAGNAGRAEEKSLSQTRLLRVACVGDSITYGFGIEERELHSYPAQLQNLLGDKWVVGNFGKNGATVLKKGHAPYWDAPQFGAALEFGPNVVIIKLGTNDSRSQNIGRYRSEFVADYLDLIRTFRNLKSKPTVLVCYPAPIYSTVKGMTDIVVQNEIIPLIEKVAIQSGVEVIDLNATLSDRKEMFPDGLHPDAEGAGLIAKSVANAVKRLALRMQRARIQNKETDICERTDMADQHSEVVSNLTNLSQWARNEIGDHDTFGANARTFGAPRRSLSEDAALAQLYDLEADVNQTTNLYHQYPEVVATMDSRLETIRP